MVNRWTHRVTKKLSRRVFDVQQRQTFFFFLKQPKPQLRTHDAFVVRMKKTDLMSGKWDMASWGSLTRANLIRAPRSHRLHTLHGVTFQISNSAMCISSAKQDAPALCDGPIGSVTNHFWGNFFYFFIPSFSLSRCYKLLDGVSARPRRFRCVSAIADVLLGTHKSLWASLGKLTWCRFC